MAKCIYDNCQNPERARGMCSAHYQKAYRKINPEYKTKSFLQRPQPKPTEPIVIRPVLNEFETINNIPLDVIYKRYKHLDNLITI